MAVGESAEALRFDQNEFLGQNDTVVTLGSFDWKVKANGNQYSADYAHVFTIRDGKVVQKNGGNVASYF